MTKLTKSLLATLIFSIICRSEGRAVTITAASCSRTDVQTAVDAAAEGDTVGIPSCPAGVPWTNKLTITKGITIQGAGIDCTVLIDNAVNDSMLAIGAFNNKDWRITGITFRGGTALKNWASTLEVQGNSHAFRIDNVKFFDWQTESRAIQTFGDLWGVIDHSIFDSNGRFVQAIQIFHDAWGGIGNYGDNSWGDADNFGTNKFIFMEDNTFTGAFAGAVDAGAGGRLVFRYNTVKSDYVVSHGTETSQRLRSVRAIEVYNNTFMNNGVEWFTGIFLRGGTAVIHNNSFLPFPGGTQGYQHAINVANFRSFDSFGPWGICNGTGAYDENVGLPLGYACIDQVGRGAGKLLSGDLPIPIGWVVEVPSPVYVWNNTGGNQIKVNSDSPHIRETIDYFVGIPKPGYLAFQYPHPLTLSTPPPPSSCPSSEGGSGGCFIATAAFGSPLAREVQLLRQFRDRALLTHAPGQLFVAAYYRASPPLAALIRQHQALRIATRGLLWPIVWGAKLALVSPGLALALGGGGLGAGAFLLARLHRAWRARPRCPAWRSKP